MRRIAVAEQIYHQQLFAIAVEESPNHRARCCEIHHKYGSRHFLPFLQIATCRLLIAPGRTLYDVSLLYCFIPRPPLQQKCCIIIRDALVGYGWQDGERGDVSDFQETTFGARPHLGASHHLSASRLNPIYPTMCQLYYKAAVIYDKKTISIQGLTGIIHNVPIRGSRALCGQYCNKYRGTQHSDFEAETWKLLTKEHITMGRGKEISGFVRHTG
jgi:hypothetical protein